MTEIMATLCLIYSPLPGNRSPYKNYYECTGPDGTKFDNTSKAELLRVLRKHYGKVNLTVLDQRKPVNRY